MIFRLTVFILGFLLWKAIYIIKHNLLLEEINNLYFYISGLGGIFAGLLVLFFIPYILTKDVRKKNILYAFILLAIFEFWFYLPKGMDILYASLRFIPLLLSMSVVLYIRSGKPLVLASGASFCLKNKRYLAQAMLVLVVIIYTLLDCLSPRGFWKNTTSSKKINILPS